MKLNRQQQIGKARASVLDFIATQPHSLAYTLRWINQQFTARALPPDIAKNFKQAWQKPQCFKLSRATFYAWTRERKQRGHSEPLVRQKSVIVKPWHELALHLKRDNPRCKVAELHRDLSQQYPTVSYRQLAYFYKGMGKS